MYCAESPLRLVSAGEGACARSCAARTDRPAAPRNSRPSLSSAAMMPRTVAPAGSLRRRTLRPSRPTSSWYSTSRPSWFRSSVASSWSESRPPSWNTTSSLRKRVSLSGGMPLGSGPRPNAATALAGGRWLLPAGRRPSGRRASRRRACAGPDRMAVWLLMTSSELLVSVPVSFVAPRRRSSAARSARSSCCRDRGQAAAAAAAVIGGIGGASCD